MRDAGPAAVIGRLEPSIRLWLAVLGATGVAATALCVLSPERPAVRIPGLAAAAGGVFGGAVLYVVLAGLALPRPNGLWHPVVRRRELPARLARVAIIGVLAANEEILWRWAGMGEMLRFGPAAAFAGSTLLFAVAHRARPGVHLLTGAAFGGLYLTTGVLLASISAHWSYNALLTAGDGGRPTPGADA
jgi:membrane protease YdiL (CAAX protease family)